MQKPLGCIVPVSMIAGFVLVTTALYVFGTTVSAKDRDHLNCRGDKCTSQSRDYRDHDGDHRKRDRHDDERTTPEFDWRGPTLVIPFGDYHNRDERHRR